MMRQNNYNNRYQSKIPNRIECSCGGSCILKMTKNYPFGMKSKATSRKFYRCNNCGKVTLAAKENKKWRR